MDEQFQHVSVLPEEAIQALDIKPDGIYVDATYGRGGHAQAIYQRLQPQGKLLVMDKDPQAIEHAHRVFDGKDNVKVVNGSFSQLQSSVEQQGWMGQVDGVLLDIGVSSPQLDDPNRGFSFKNDGALDMRMDPSQGVNAADWINSVAERELADVLRTYGEERYAKRIAKAIVSARQEQTLDRTKQLADIIAEAHPSWEPGKDPATRSFQAIRIFLNGELDELKACLPQALHVLKAGGRLAVISFHSLEDRIVKRYMREQARGDDFPADLPVMHSQLNPTLRVIGKSKRAGELELVSNPRARSAVMRIAEKL